MDTSTNRDIVKSLLTQYGLNNAHVEPVEPNDHHILRVTGESGRYCLKLGVDATETQVRSQLEYMDHLRAGGVPMVDVVATTGGRGFTKVGDTVGLLFRWIDGRSMGTKVESALIEESGALLAKLHVRASGFEPSRGFHRKNWNAIYASNEAGWLEKFFAQGLVDDAAQGTIARAARRVHAAVQRLPNDETTYGLIHADFHGNNLIHDGKTIHIIDFEDCGWGHWLFDVTWPAALFGKAHGASADFLKPFLKGYQRVRPWTSMEMHALPDFMLAAGIAVLEMVHTSSIQQDGLVAREWHAFAVDWLEQLLGEAG